MNISLPIGKSAGYRSNSQIARVVTESWGSRELFCLNCSSDRLSQTPANTRAVDFTCSGCSALYQLKSCRTPLPARLVDGAHSAMIEAIAAGRTPNLVALAYTPAWTVHDLVVIPSFMFRPSAIERRKPLAATARRAGWVGCNIRLRELVSDTGLSVITAGKVSPPESMRLRYSKLRPLSQVSPKMRGWTLDLFHLVRSLGTAKFSLRDLYAREASLEDRWPDNHNIRAKIRQQLQVLRDLGFITFVGSGNYSLCVSPEPT